MIAPALSRSDIHATLRAIARVQRRDGSIPWFDGGQVDPWNHVECAMALDAGGYADETTAAYAWLARTQRADGSWCAAYRDGGILDGTLDSNLCAYVAAGAWMRSLCGASETALRELLPVVERALAFVVAMQGGDGVVAWARDANGSIWPSGLVTGSSCVHLSLACGSRLAARLGVPHPEWDEGRARLRDALLHRCERFMDKRRWAMDWYYPVLCGVVTGEDASARIASRWDEFIVPQRGVRCVADRPWVTAAETCELALALVRIGERARATELLRWADHLRGDDAAYFTGANFTDGCVFPPHEQPTWTAAAVVLAHDAVNGGVTAELFAATR